MRKRFLALAMVLVFCVGLMPMAALAADDRYAELVDGTAEGPAEEAEETEEHIDEEYAVAEVVTFAGETDVSEEDSAASATDGVDVVATVDGKEYSSFESAIAAGSGGTVIMQSDVSYESSPCKVNGTITLDLNGCTISGSNRIRALLQLNSPAVLTIEDSSTDGSGTITQYGRTFRLNQDVTIIINGGNFTDTGSQAMQMGPLAVEGTGVTIEINGGTFSGNYYDSYVESSGSATYTLADSLAGFRVNVASGGSATLNGIWKDSSGTKYTDATVSTAGTYTFMGSVDDDSGEDTDTPDDGTSDNEDSDGTGTAVSVTVGCFTAINSVTVTVDNAEYALEENTHYTYMTKGSGPTATVTFYFTDEFVAAMPNGTYTITVTGTQGPNEDVVETAVLTIGENTVGGTADNVTGNDSGGTGDTGGTGSTGSTGSTDSTDSTGSSGSSGSSGNASSGQCGANLYWIIENGVLTISGTGEMYDFSDYYDVPWYSSRSSITSVVIEDGATSIGSLAFNHCTSLKSITIPESVTSIGSYAFANCTKLASVSYGGTIEQWIRFYEHNTVSSFLWNATVTDCAGSTLSRRSYGTGGDDVYWLLTDGILYIFGAGDMTGFELPSINDYYNEYDKGSESEGETTGDSTYDEYHGFFSGYNVTSVVIGDGITGICSNAFAGCQDLVEISIPDSVTSIGRYAFSNCTSLKNIALPSGLETIGSYAFFCAYFTEINIPNSVTSIGANAFSCCTSLTEITFPDSVTSIGDYVFSYCTGITEITFPDNVTSIGKGICSGCTGLRSAVIGDGITAISESAFYGCLSLRSVTIGSGVTTIGDSAFYDCASLSGIVIPDSVITIGENAFRECSTLTEITIPASVTYIGNSAFMRCTSLETITFEGDAPAPGGGNIFSGVKATGYYPADNDTWTDEIMDEYGGNITWKVIGEEEPAASVTVTIETDGTVTINVTGLVQINQLIINGVSLTLGEDYTAEQIEDDTEEGAWAITVFSAAVAALDDAEALEVTVTGVNADGETVSATSTDSDYNDNTEDAPSPSDPTGNTGSGGTTGTDSGSAGSATNSSNDTNNSSTTDDDTTSLTPVPSQDEDESGEDGDHTPGDINNDGIVNISDVQSLLKYVNGQNISVREAALDVNGDGTVNISDVQALLKSVNGQSVTIY